MALIKPGKRKKGSVASAAGGLAVTICSYLLLAAVNAFLEKKNGK